MIKISKKATTIAIVNQKGGTGKTTTCENLGIGLAMEGKKVLLVDADPQGSLTISMGWQQPDELPTTLSTLMAKAMNDQSIPPGEGILHHAEGVDLIPANIELAGLEVSLVNCMNREKMLKQVLGGAKHDYDFILLDCTPSLGMLTVNALAAADTTLIPVQAQYLSAKGLEQLLQTVQKVRRQINPKLKIEGILLTMTDSRTNYGQQISNLIRQAYGKHLKVFEQTIPRSVRAAETSAVGKSIKFELSFVNMATDSTEFEKSIRIPYQRDGFDDVRAEYSQMLRQQLAKGNNGLTKTKFITFGVEGESMRQVKARLDHIQNDLLNNFHRLGVQAKPLNGAERLKLMHDMFNMDGSSKFHFDWKDLVKSGLSVKDAIAPTVFAFKNSRTFQMGGIYCAASFLSITASDISDQLLKDFLDMDSSQIVTMHIQSVDQNRAIKTVKRTITELDRSTIEEQKKAIRSGYDIDILPSDLKTYGRDAKALLKELQSQNERMFLVTFLVLNTGRTEQELENNIFQASSIAQKHNCNLCRLDYQQEQGLMSSLPLADCQIEIQRGLTTSSTAIFIPFTTQELYQSSKESLYYGLNALSNNLIMVDRKRLKNPNGLILGTPGSGKSFSAKREIANAFLVTDDDIIVNDPEGEYSPLVNRLKGQVIKISPNSTQFINPMDINANYSEEDNPLSLKADFILSLCELVVGGKEGLLPVEKTVIDRCVHLIYRKYFADPCPENMPILEDLYNALLQQDEKEAHHVATALEIYVKGSLNLFNHRTNVNVNNRIVCYDIKELGKQMKKLGMLIVQDQVWGRVTANRSSGKSTRYYMDEMHLLLKEEQTAAYSVEIWKRFRKWGGIPTGLTQNVKDLLSSREVENIFENSDMIIMLNQAAGDRQILAKQLNISPHQLSYVTHSGEGEGLLFFGNVILPFVDRFPTDLELYRIMTTKLGEVSEGAQK